MPRRVAQTRCEARASRGEGCRCAEKDSRMKKTKARAYTKLSRRDRAEQAAKEGLTPVEEAPALPAVKAVKQKPGPLTLDDMRSEMLKRAGFSLSLMKGAIEALERNLTSEEPFAQLTAARTILQLSNSFPSRQARVP